jgi:hypothetical protein
VIGSFDAPQGHGMDVDSQGFVYIGQNTVRKYDPKTGQMVKEVARVPEAQPQGGGGRGGNAEPAAQAGAVAAFRARYPPTTPMIVGQIEEIRLDGVGARMVDRWRKSVPMTPTTPTRPMGRCRRISGATSR